MFLGWSPTAEQVHFAAVKSMRVSRNVVAAPVSVPDVLDPSWFVQQDQGPRNTCHAHARTGCSEYLYWLKTQQVIQFSRRFAAITDALMDERAGWGNHRVDQGASILGSCRASQEFGEVVESNFPYWSQSEPYSGNIPQSIYEAATKRRIRTLLECQNYDDFDTAMITGQWAANIGISWTSGWANLSNVAELDQLPGGSKLGGHALCLFGWDTRPDGRWYWMHNSHLGWGRRQRMLLSPRLIDRMLKTSQFGAVLVSDIAMSDDDQVPVPPVDWAWVQQAQFASHPTTFTVA